MLLGDANVVKDHFSLVFSTKKSFQNMGFCHLTLVRLHQGQCEAEILLSAQEVFVLGIFARLLSHGFLRG